jgi:hypothetical protein
VRARIQWAPIVLGLAALAALPPATTGTGITADLDGQAIAPRHVADYYCHDLESPRIHCFETQSELDAAVAAWGIGPLVPTALASSISYVHVFVDSQYRGASAYLSQDYVDLGVIGWADTISSLIALNSQVGRFYEHTWYGGSSFYFCCNTSVAYVGDLYNDTFSSVRKLT